jgi:uncharacterized protein (TIGR03435 family)
VISTVPLPEDEKYDVVFCWPKADLDTGRALLQQAIESAFNLQVRRERRTTPVYVLSAPHPAALSLTRAMSRVYRDAETGHVAPTSAILERMNAGEKFFLAMGDTGALADNLGVALGCPVVDEATIDGYYSFCLPFDLESGDPSGLVNAIQETYGFELAPAERVIEVLVVDGPRDPSLSAQH